MFPGSTGTTNQEVRTVDDTLGFDFAFQRIVDCRLVNSLRRTVRKIDIDSSSSADVGNRVDSTLDRD